MIAYENALTNYTGVAFPDISAKNITAPAAGDGTEWIAAWANNQMGVMQAVLNYVGFTPNGVDESASNSQFLSALKGFVPAGTVVAWHGSNDMSLVPGGRWIQLEGQVVLIADYIDLMGNCYVGDGNNSSYPFYYKSSDAGGSIRDTGGAYFKLPDARGLVLRGHDPSDSHDPEGSARQFPDIQFDALEQHSHRVYDTVLGRYPYGRTLLLQNGTTGYPVLGTQATYDGVDATDTIFGASSDAFETRMVNIQAKFAVRY
jgi:hypothetical protein